MEWKWRWNDENGKNGTIDVTPYLLFESTGDSEEVKADVHHHHHEEEEEEEEEVAMDVCQGVSFQDDDDAQSCSYDHSFYSNTSYSNNNHDQAQGLIYDGYDHEEDEDQEAIDDDDDDEKNKNRGESKQLVGPQKGSHKFCVDSSNQREIDRQFWETCLAS